MTPFRAPGEIPACSRCGVRLEMAAAARDPEGRYMCPPCKAKFDGRAQDQKALSLILPIVLGGSLLIVLLMFVAIGFVVYRAVGAH